MTTAVYTRQDLAVSTTSLPLCSVESDYVPGAEQQAVTLMAFMAGMAVDKEAEAAIRAEQEEYRRQLNAYIRNRYGDCQNEPGTDGAVPLRQSVRAVE